MPTVMRSEAADRLTQQVHAMNRSNLLDFHNELFPEDPISEIDTKDVSAVRRKVLDYLGRGVEVEEILDLWNVVFPDAWNVYYDDETDEIHYRDEPDAIRQPE